MTKDNSKIRAIISGGGTGGHIFPAISIANELKKQISNIEILFVGAEGKMEMEKVPAAGYKIVGLPVAGFQRRLTLKNVSFFYKLFASMLKAKKVTREFKPNVVIGVGGYASGPVLRVATNKNIPTLIQEQNSFPGVTNRILSKKVSKICVAYPSMEKFFPQEKIVYTGNPIRQSLLEGITRERAARYFNLDPNKKVVFVTGGSLGARTINEGIKKYIDQFTQNDIQLIWQTGKYYYKSIMEEVSETESIKIMAFVDNMEAAFALADIVVSRAGASSISEMSVLQKAVVFVPSPNVSEDHQTKNAKALVDKNAALMIADKDAVEVLVPDVIKLVEDTKKLSELKNNIAQFAMRNASSLIVDEVLALVKKK
ncbi:undecaprenyldiphospho-muramoylpentapeptide beta-N-acetylglucosaminyltransferase [Saccharicrinis aurantiacus]|uniref:undecaprenyldiphospho-muramoylpentapeptide beta-N-acetylglucosaminyltransferase n=1 Tax=Saccharicrinis aurantiacus TaxID=1849719 RepID=UPI0024902A56|nr:undecaprenyldiphospho-muramoylpentapeptide beta-N-acetylglucosaminyltransferase [Saccharicrinis aurantiacus]